MKEEHGWQRSVSAAFTTDGLDVVSTESNTEDPAVVARGWGGFGSSSYLGQLVLENNLRHRLRLGVRLRGEAGS